MLTNMSEAVLIFFTSKVGDSNVADKLCCFDFSPVNSLSTVIDILRLAWLLHKAQSIATLVH